MTYSLVNMPVLGFDLCRLAGGRTIAEILLRTLQLDEAGTAELAARPRGHRPVSRPRPVPALAATLRDLREDPTVPVASAQSVRILERSMLGDFDALVRLVRDDMLDWTWDQAGSVRFQHPDAVATVEIVVDLMADVYADERTPRVTEHLVPGGPAAASDIDLGPQADAVHGLLDAVASMTPPQVAAMRSVATGAARAAWANAVHDASWAVYLTGRLRPAAAAQLLAVRAFGDAGFTARDGAHGVWNALSGAVQATVVADLIDGDSASLLTSHCRWALGA